MKKINGLPAAGRLGPPGFRPGPVEGFCTYPYIGDLARTIGGERVEVTVLAKGTDDPHFVVPKPSFLAKLRAADLLIVNGADLEIGFGPVLIQQSNNPKIQSPETGLLDLSRSINLREVPAVLSRAEGDVHPQGNPHFHLDPHHIPVLARAVAGRLSALDRSGGAQYQRLLTEFLVAGRKSRGNGTGAWRL